ncbi:DUF6509 family protein [Paenibacillus terrigena]|uniref:DUF6509 family protein n=1 Tax=Paenibacillus terrigena TaxID=369333 RepID=UPI000360334B|nr:DUF6509 family protein [Paenibacillus terrigena]
MINITAFEVELIKDPFGILSGTRYEFKLDIDVPEDDELWSENGLYIRVIYVVEENRTGIVKYELYEKTTGQYLDMDLEEDEVAAVDAFCQANYGESSE